MKYLLLFFLAMPVWGDVPQFHKIYEGRAQLIEKPEDICTIILATKLGENYYNAEIEVKISTRTGRMDSCPEIIDGAFKLLEINPTPDTR